MTDLEGKVVLITGSGKGSGRELARAFAEHGAIVATNDISPINLDTLVADIHARGGQAKAYVEDVAKKVGAQALVKQVEDDFGHIDVLINHASVEPKTPLLDMDEWDWRRTLDVNLTGAFLMTQSAGRVMRARGQGLIINLFSTLTKALEKTVDSEEGRTAYLTSMAGLEAFSQQAARELRIHGIRVHTISTEAQVNTVLSLCKISL